MKRIFIAIICASATLNAFAQQGKAPDLPQPPPYGAYFLDILNRPGFRGGLLA
jgi:hypothetical protein